MTAQLYDLDVHHTIQPPTGVEGLVKHEVDFNALPAPTRERLTSILSGQPTPIPRWLGFSGQGCSPTCLMVVALPAMVFLGAAALFFVFRYSDYRVPSAPLMFPFFLVGLVGLLVFPLVGHRKRAIANLRPYPHDRAYLLSARHVVWVDGDKLTLVPFDPARVYVADVIDSSSKAVTGAYVKLQMGASPFAHVDESLGRFSDRATADARRVAIQQDLEARRAAIQQAVARGDAPAAGALDPFWEIGDGWSELAAAGAPVSCAEGPAIQRTKPISPLVNYGPLVALAPVVLGGCCLSGVANFFADVAAYTSARSVGTPEAFDDYVIKGSYFEDSAREARVEAIQGLIFGIRRETLGEAGWFRKTALEELLAKYPRGPHVEGLEAEIARLEKHSGKLTLADGPIGVSEDGEDEAPVVERASALKHVKVGQRYVFSMAGTRQEWTITAVEGDRVDYTVQNVEEDGSRAVPTEWRAKDAGEPSDGTSLGEATRTFGDQTFRCRGWRTAAGGENVDTWVPFDDDGVIFPAKVRVAHGQVETIQLIEVLDPKG